MNLPDIFESMERAAESRTEMDSEGRIACCDCGRFFPVSQLSPASASPYAPPVCDDCLGATP